jgi:hypothetical protein
MTGEKPIILAALQVHLRKIDGWRFLGTEPNRPDEKNREAFEIVSREVIV